MNDDVEVPWTQGVRGEQVLPLINADVTTLRVPAGPGTGKTFALRKRVLRLLHPEGLSVPSDKVLVCAFNRVIRDDLTEAIAAELEPFGSIYPWLRRFINATICPPPPASAIGGFTYCPRAPVAAKKVP